MRPAIAAALFALAAAATAADPPPAPADTAAAAVKAAGGADKLLKLFRIKEQLNVSGDPDKKGTVRVSVLEPPGYWWVGKRERVKAEKEPATFLVHAWTLGILTDPKSKLESIPGVTENDKATVGLKVSGSVAPPMSLYFDADHKLVRIDWRADIHRFSDWKAHDGVRYPAKTVGYKAATGKAWYFSEIVELERLKELPPGLTRD